jgi:oligopeptide/dipeptide ABC transporter ATP-binding protein
MLVRLHRPTGGEIFFAGEDVLAFTGADLLRYRRKVQMIFPDPSGALNPRMTAEEIVAEPLLIHKKASGRDEALARARELLQAAAVPYYKWREYPGQFSLGQLQRVCLARAMVLELELLICDEPVSALDVSSRGWILNLFKRWQRERQLSFLFISHDLAAVRFVCDRTMVMYAGKIVEVNSTDGLFRRPAHPYTGVLSAAALLPDPALRYKRKVVPAGEAGSCYLLTSCKFFLRCAHAGPVCAAEEPALLEIGEGHFVACHFPFFCGK